jgi:hypothetical protein
MHAGSFVLALAMILGSNPASVEAASVYEFAFGQSVYQADPGAEVLVDVYLRESVSDGTASVLATDGLIGAGLRLSFGLSPLPSNPATLSSESDVMPNDGAGGFDGAFQSIDLVSGSHVDLTETTDLLSPAVLAEDLGGGVFQILLGTFRFVAGSIGGQTTLLRAEDIAAPFSDTITGGGEELDVLIASGTASIRVSSVSAVPEPSSWVGLMLGLSGLGVLRAGVSSRRRMKAA